MANQQGGRSKTGSQTGSSMPSVVPEPETPATSSSTGSDTSHDRLAANISSPQAGDLTPGRSVSGGIGTDSDRPITGEIRSAASEIYDKAKETASDTYDAVAAKATTKIEERKGEVSTGLKTVADSFRKTGTELKSSGQPNQLTDLTARYSGTAARKIEQVADYFERKDLRAIMRDTEDFARRNPAIFLGAAFALGVVAARFLKSSTPDQYTSRRETSMPTGKSALPSGNPTAKATPQLR